MLDYRRRPKPDWKVGLVPAIAFGIFVYVAEQILYRRGSEEGIDIGEAMYDFGSKVARQIFDREE